jgi:hypothetical protein
MTILSRRPPPFRASALFRKEHHGGIWNEIAIFESEPSCEQRCAAGESRESEEQSAIHNRIQSGFGIEDLRSV